MNEFLNCIILFTSKNIYMRIIIIFFFEIFRKIHF